ncbi:hypothetical protein [Staphylococcus xylosus]|uniref:hypothetical protein n=1 Tax=Staphylococcus xylosus TaxID=1288 RepID=UPI002DBB39C3|nr:hypothetical protein [Staphylococcus xylosus]MEB8101606.1 hypothetical protein [Staphylococcus xylosus]
MDNINVYLKTSESNFWYEHGVELGAAIVTLVAFLFTFWNINRTNKRQELEEQKKNNKTLKMIDLVTQEQSAKLKEINKKINKKIESEPKLDTNGNYFLTVEEPYTKEIETQIKESVNLNDIAKYVNKDELSSILINYQKEVTDIMVSQHTNLNLEALDKVTTKLENIENTLKKIDEIKSYIYVCNAIRKMERKNIQVEFQKYNDLNKLIENSSRKLIYDIYE